MRPFDIHSTVGEMVADHPALSRVFEEVGIDYCCGGQQTLEEACGKKGLDPRSIVARLERAQSNAEKTGDAVDVAAMSLSELADHIEQVHHAYLHTELPRVDRMTEKVASVHGEKDPRIPEVRKWFLALAEELSSHMMKEERILFPMIRQLERGEEAPTLHCGTIANPIRQMELEHDRAGSALDSLRELTDNYVPPEWACGTYRALLDALARLEQDMHQHIHKENNVLFPRAIEMEAQREGGALIS
jgi:regulator of cell morphogenesis and NO signaling